MTQLVVVRHATGDSGPMQEVQVDPSFGPLLSCPDGTTSYVARREVIGKTLHDTHPDSHPVYSKTWKQMTSTERTVALDRAARTHARDSGVGWPTTATKPREVTKLRRLTQKTTEARRQEMVAWSDERTRLLREQIEANRSAAEARRAGLSSQRRHTSSPGKEADVSDPYVSGSGAEAVRKAAADADAARTRDETAELAAARQRRIASAAAAAAERREAAAEALAFAAAGRDDVASEISAGDMAEEEEEEEGNFMPDACVDGEEHDAAKRCAKEFARKTSPWQYVPVEAFMARWQEELPGMRYGLKFPHSREMLLSSRYGAVWLTQAFHRAGTLSLDNNVTRILSSKPVSGGGAAAKCVIDVQYARPASDLHTRLFVKYPFDFSDYKQKSDRMNSSVMLQPADCGEVDAYRLLEASLPFTVPKYYFADINNESTNFILVTEFIQFANKESTDVAKLRANVVQPAYEKFLDDEQFPDAYEYYRTWTEANAKMAAWYKTGRLGDQAVLGKFFPNTSKGSPVGLVGNELKVKLDMGEDFLGTRMARLFPAGVMTADTLRTTRRILTAVNTHKSDIFRLAHMDEDYLSMMHGNLNCDNTWWWRDSDGALQMGALDWAGLSKAAISQKLWWSYYACEFHMLEDHLDDLLQLFVDVYAREGGPAIDRQALRRDFCFAALDQCLGLLGAIPQVYREIKKAEWESVTDVRHPKIQNSLLTRMYVKGFILVITMLVKFDLAKMVDDLFSH